MQMRTLSYISIALFIFLGCEKSDLSDPIPTDRGYEYMPLEVGKSWTYQLDSIVFDPEPGRIQVDTISQQMQLVVADTFRDGEDRLTYRVERFTRDHDTSSWEITDVWSFVREEFRFIWNEENLSFIKLVFPPQLGDTWDGNALINDDDIMVTVRGESLEFFKFWGDYRLSQMSDSLELLGHTYYDVITIDQVDREVLIEKRFSLEQYSKDVGLVYKKLEIMDTQNLNTALPFEQRAERGFILEMTLLTYQ